MLCNTENALEAIRRGFQPIPLVTGDKKARISGWPKLRWENTEEGLAHAREKFDDWAEQGHGGLGVLLGKPSGDLIDIDLDHPKTARLKDHFLPPTQARSGRDSRPSTHYWYIAKPGTLQESRTFKLPPREDPDMQMIVEYRSTGGQTALPGNLHPSGDLYRWAGKPWGGEAGPMLVDGRALLVQTALLGFCTLIVNYWPGRGARHEAYLALAGGLLRVGDTVHPYWERNIAVVIAAIADATNDDDGAEARITETVETTIKRLREGRSASGFGKLAEIMGDDVVKQARVILAEIESAAGLPSRTSGELSVEKIDAALRGEAPRAETSAPAPGPATHAERLSREGIEEDEDGDELPSTHRDPLEERTSTWEALDLEPYLTGQVQTVEPSVMERVDGQALMYPGRLNMIYGPSESAKSWIVMFTCQQLLERGERVVYLDFEDEPVNALERMRLIGATYDDLRTSFRYVRPEDPLGSMQRSRWGESRATEEGRRNEEMFQSLLDEHDPALIVADGMTMLYGLHGLDSNDSVQTDTITTWLKSLTRNGRTTVIIVDHTAKDPQRGSLPIGSQHKVSMVQGSMLQAYPVRQPMPNAVGEVELIVLKDRPGKLRAVSEKSGKKAQLAARLIMDSTTPGETKMTLNVPPSTVSDDAAKAQEKVQEVDLKHQREAERREREHDENARVLDMFGGEIGAMLSMREMVELYHGLPDGKHASNTQKNVVRRAVERLRLEGWIGKAGSTQGALYVLEVTEVD